MYIFGKLLLKSFFFFHFLAHIFLMDIILMIASSPDQSEPVNNDNELVHSTPKSFGTWASPSNGV